MTTKSKFKQTERLEEQPLDKKPVTAKELLVVLVVVLIDFSIAFHYYTTWGASLSGIMGTVIALGYGAVAFGKSAFVRILYMWKAKAEIAKDKPASRRVILYSIVIIGTFLYLDIITTQESVYINDKTAIASNNTDNEIIRNLLREKKVELNKLDMLIERASNESTRAMMTAKKEKKSIDFDRRINSVKAGKIIEGSGRDLTIGVFLFGILLSLTSTVLVVYHGMFIRPLHQLKSVFEENVILKTKEREEEDGGKGNNQPRPTPTPPAPKPTPTPPAPKPTPTPPAPKPAPKSKHLPAPAPTAKKRDYISSDIKGQSVKVIDAGSKSKVVLFANGKPLTEVVVGVFIPKSTFLMINAGRAEFEKALPEITSNIDDLLDLMEAWSKGDTTSYSGSDDLPSMRKLVLETQKFGQGDEATCPSCKTKFKKPQRRSYHCGADKCRKAIRAGSPSPKAA